LPRLPLFELAHVLVRFDHVARFIVNANRRASENQIDAGRGAGVGRGLGVGVALGAFKRNVQVKSTGGPQSKAPAGI